MGIGTGEQDMHMGVSIFCYGVLQKELPCSKTLEIYANYKKQNCSGRVPALAECGGTHPKTRKRKKTHFLCLKVCQNDGNSRNFIKIPIVIHMNRIK